MTDLISKSALLNSTDKESIHKYEIALFPTIEPKRGSWMLIERREPQFDLCGTKTWAVAYRCSECGFIHTVIEDFGHYAFCPNCGAQMQRSEE